MSSVDNRVVAMKFDNKQFQAGVKDTMGSLTDLNQSLKMEGATKGLANVSDAVSKFSLGKIGEAVDSIAGRFSAMSIVAITALTNIANKAVDAGLQLVKSLTIAPIADGFNDYNEKLTSVKTIMNATGESIQVVDGYFKELDTYADKTVYNLKDMTGAFAKFTNAGVGMEQSVPAIKGIANMVALAGQGADAASIAMYNLSQSIAGGFLTTTDYKSLNLANVATKEWKENMVAAAVAAGTLKQTAPDAYTLASDASGKAYTTASLFNEALAEGWATSDILLGVLGNYGDATTELGAKAQAAAQDVKSLPMMMETLKASVGTGWTETFELLLGNVEESTKLFTGLTGVIQGLLDTSSNARNALISDWVALGGKEALIQGIKNAWEALKAVLKPIKEAFTDIFPPATGKTLLEITEAFKRFTAGLMINSTQADNLKRTFKGVFAIFSIGWEVIKQLFGVFGDLTGGLDGAGDGILGFTAKIGDWLVKVNDAVKKGTAFNDFFQDMRTRIKNVITVIKEVVGWFGDMIDKLRGLDASGAGDAVQNLGGRFERIQAALSSFMGTLGKVGGWLKDFWNWLQPAFAAIGDFFSGLGDKISDGLSGMNFDSFLDAVNTGLLAGLVLVVKKFLKGGIDLNLDAGGGIFETIKGTFGELTNTLKTMQTKVKADAILKIAGAVAVLVVSVIALSMIDSGKLYSALGALTIMFVQLGAALAVFDKIGSAQAGAKMGILAVAFGLLGAAILILVASVKILSTMDWEGLGKGLAGVTVLMGLLVGASQAMSKNTKGALTGAAAMVVMAGAIAILAGVVKLFSMMSWEELGKGIGMIVVTLGILVGASLVLGKGAGNMIRGAGALLIMAGALGAISAVVSQFGDMDWEQIAKGLVAMAGSLAIMAGAMYLMSAGLPGAAAMVVGAAAVLVMSYALETMGEMSWESIAKAVVLLVASLAILAGAMYLMSAGLPGAAAMLVISAALAVLAPVLVMLGEMSWEAIGKGLVALAGAFAAIAIGGMLLIPALVPLAAFAVIVAVLGAGLLLAGAGVLAFATGLATLAAIGAAAAVVLSLMVETIIALIPKAMAAVADGIVEFARIISESGPTFVAAMVTLITSLATAIDTTAPVVVNTIINLITLLLDAINKNLPKFIDKGSQIIVNFLNGVAKNMPQITTAAGNLIIAFIEGIGAQSARIAEAGADTVIKFVNSLASTIRTRSEEMNAAGRNLASAIIEGMASGLTGGVNAVITAAKGVAQSALNAAKKLLGIASPSKAFKKIGAWTTEGFVEGINTTAKTAEFAGENLGTSAIDGIKRSLSNTDKLMAQSMDINPTITPVLDLSKVKREAARIDGLLTPSVPKIDTSNMHRQASYVATEQRGPAPVADPNPEWLRTPGAPLVEVNQTINSPVALSDAEIYRNTKNLFSTVKEALP